MESSPRILRTDRLFEKYYYSDPEFVDGTTQFHQLCQKYIPAGSKILEIGPGPRNQTTDYLASIGEVTGADISVETLDNRSLNRAFVYDGSVLPFENKTFDACVSNFVLEHVEMPEKHFQEVARVLKTGGVYCLRTPNLWHYVALVSRMLPHSLHSLANPLRGLDAEAHEPYPTFYKANTKKVLARFCREFGLQITELCLIEKDPSYGRAHEILFFPMMTYERVVNRFGLLEGFRANILAVFSKKKQNS